MKNLLVLTIFVFPHLVLAVDINTANVEELAHELFGIGPVKAQRIVEYREKIGGFISIEQLKEVHGIGPKTLERNKNKIEISTINWGKNDVHSIKITKQSKVETQADKMNSSSKPETLQSVSNLPDVNLNLSPSVKKPSRQTYRFLWDALIIIPLFIACLLIFMVAWLKNVRKEKPIPRTHLLSTTFICARCGKVNRFQNVHYEGHFSHLHIDDELPPGWSCIPNWLGKPCDYCFDCSQKIHVSHLTAKFPSQFLL